MDWTKLSEYGVAVLALLLALGLLDLVRRKYRQSVPGERRSGMATVIECPNKIETLPTILDNIGKRLIELIRLHEEHSKVALRAVGMADTLIRQHAPVDGVEQWKIPPDAVKTIRDSQAIQVRTLDTVEKITGQNERVLRLLEKKVNGG